MKGLELKPELIRAELSTFKQRLQQSYATLRDLDPVDIGQTPRQLVFENDKTRLYYYAPDSARDDNPIDDSSNAQPQTPLLICYALVNRPWIVDLQPDRSLLRELLARGIPVYLIDWGSPDASDRFLELDDYINDYLDSCVQACCEHANSPQLNLAGICQGGTFSLCYTALHPQRIKNLITLVTPVDFHTPDFTLSRLAMKVDAALAVKTYGNIPGELLNDTYSSLMPMRLGVQKNLGMPAQLADPQKAMNFLRMEQWIQDSPDQAGEAFRQFIEQFFQQNLLVKSEARIGEAQVDLKRITQPLLNVYALQDHLVPPSSSRALNGATASIDYQELTVNAGHIGIFVSNRGLKQLPDAIAHWLRQHD